MRYLRGILIGACVLAAVFAARAQEFYTVRDANPQPLLAQAMRLEEALASLGNKLSPDDDAKLKALKDAPQNEELSQAIQGILDRYCIALVHINPEMRVKVLHGPATPELIQDGWRTFLVKVHNESGTRAALGVESPNALPLFEKSSGQPEPKPENAISPGEVANRFLEVEMYQHRPMEPMLSGQSLEYAVVQVYTKETGKKSATLAFNAGEGTKDLGFRDQVDILFDCKPSVKVVLHVKDDDGKPAMASFVITDEVERFGTDPDVDPKQKLDYHVAQSRGIHTGVMLTQAQQFTGVYPLPSRRLAETDEYPDFFFHPQVYRADGEHIFLPPGKYTVAYTRGPEYLPQVDSLVVPDNAKETEHTFQLKRWIHLAALGYYSADHHVHAGGCSHYESPQAGVDPPAMLREAEGEDLNVSCVLTWGPCWYHQKTFFEGKVNQLSTALNLMRYDVEVSGFPSSHAGHVCLLRLKNDDYPGTTKIEEWPSWTLPVLQWAKQQGGVVGYAHSGWGLEPIEPTNDLPNYVMAKFDGIGANEYIVTAVHDACDFISAGDTPWPWEMNIWYHTLNCGMRTRISGETDFPCIYDERVGIARSYAPMDGKLDFDGFIEKIKQGANYVSDGKSHILDFKVNDTKMGVGASEAALAAAGTVHISARLAAFLPQDVGPAGEAVSKLRPSQPPYWNIERARIGTSRKVPVELVVNGFPVQKLEIDADGQMRDVSFDCPIKQSSWVALRVPFSCHTNPIFVIVNGQPVRASKRSAEWCRAAVDRCWQMKKPAIREPEQSAAAAAYDVARAAYDKIVAESTTE